ncbi:MAG: hypothetical protein IJA78_00030 [Clostridia bacterium]|nr:hypothetical protein [Clostridia bacterium]
MKKKLLALLLAVWMVVAMLPMTVLAEALPTNQTESSAVGRPVIEIEDLTPSTAVTVLDDAGEIVVESAQDLSAAMHEVKEGYTLKLTAGTVYSCDTAIVLESPACAWTLDGNGAVLYGGTADDFLLTVGGDGSDVTVKNLTVASVGSGVRAGMDETDKASALTLENVRVFAGGSYGSADANGSGAAYVVSGPASYLRIVGDDTYAYAPNASEFFICNYGQLGIYAGVFANGAQGACDAYLVTRSFSTANSDANGRYAPTTTIYGGTFVGSSTTTKMIQSNYGGTNIILGGVFILLNTASTPILAGAVNGYGYNYIYGGEFYSKSLGKIYNPSVANNTYTEFAGGAFYGQTAESITNAKKTTMVAGDYLTRVYFGTRLDAYYKVTASTATVTVDNKNGDYHLVDEANGTYKNITTVGYNTANTAVSAKLAAVGGSIARIAEVADIEVTDGNTPISKFFFDFEIDRAMRSVGDGGRVMLLNNVARVINSADTTFYAAVGGIQGHILSPYFSYTLTSKGSAHYTLSVECVGTVANPCYALNFFGGSITMENVNLLSNQANVRGLMETSYEGNYTVLAIRNVTISSSGSQAVVMHSQDGSVLNVYEGVTLEGISSVETHGNGATVNVWGGTLIGGSNRYVFYIETGAQSNKINVWGGTLDAKDIFFDRGTETVVNAFDGVCVATNSLVMTYAKNSIYSFGASDSTTAPTMTSVCEYPFVFNGGSGSTINVYGGTYTGKTYALWIRANSASQTFNVYGGTLIGNGTGAIRTENATDSRINIYDGALQSARIFYDAATRTVVSMRAGTYTAVNALVEALGTGGVFHIGVKGDDSVLTQAVACTYPLVFNGGSNNTINLNAGTHTGTHATNGCVWFRQGTGNTLNVTGGAAVSTATAAAGGTILVAAASNGATINVTGGKLISAGTSNLIQNAVSTTKLNITGGVLMTTASSAYYAYTSTPNSFFSALPGATVEANGTGGLSATVSSFVGEHNGIAYHAWINTAATDAAYSPEMKTGAQVRMAADSNGLRFVSTVSAETVAALEARADAGTSVSYGTLIVPASYVVDAQGVFTHAALKAANKIVADVVATSKGMSTAQDGSKTIRAALVNIKTENYNLAYAAVSYAKVTVGGQDTYFYSAFSSINNTRSLSQTCDAALRSVQPNAGITNGVYYGYASIVLGVSGYSRYNNAQQRVLAQYAGLRVSE